MLGESTEAIESASIVEEAETCIELRLSKLGQALPHILGNDVPLTVFGSLTIVDLTSCDEDLRKVGIDGETKG